CTRFVTPSLARPAPTYGVPEPQAGRTLRCLLLRLDPVNDKFDPQASRRPRWTFESFAVSEAIRQSLLTDPSRTGARTMRKPPPMYPWFRGKPPQRTAERHIAGSQSAQDPPLYTQRRPIDPTGFVRLPPEYLRKS